MQTLVCLVRVLYLVVVGFGLLKASKLVRQPYGLKMCDILREGISGYPSFVFDATHLMCQINDSKDVNKNSNCPVNTRYLNTRTKGLACISRPRRIESVPTTSSEERSMGLSIIGVNEWKISNYLYQITFEAGDTIVRQYPYIKRSSITAVAYIACAKKLLLATWKPERFLSAALKSRSITILRKNMGASDFAIDESRQFVFLLHVHTCTVVRMPMKKASFKTKITIFAKRQFSFQMLSIDIDQAKETVYVVVRMGKVMAFNYEGRNVHEVLHRGYFMAAAINPMGKTIYFPYKSHLNMMSLSNNSVRSLGKMHGVAVKMKFFEGNIYVAYTDGVDVCNNSICSYLKPSEHIQLSQFTIVPP